MIRPRVYLDGYAWDIRSRNSDWSYVEHKMPRVADWEPDIEFVLQKSPSVTLRMNYKAVRAALGRRIGAPMDPWTADTDRLNGAELLESKCNVIFSHREFPLNVGNVPVVWMHAIIDPEMTKSFHKRTVESVAEEFSVKGALFRKATMVQVCTEAEAARHAKTFPDIADRFVAVPLFGPHLSLSPESLLNKHHSNEPVRILFVGNEARRKGLPELFKAFMELSQDCRRRAELMVISHFDDGPVTIPRHPAIEVKRGLTPAEVMQLMARSHILVNVAYSESYGMVFLEAMSQGTLCIAPSWEVQRELFDYGRAGITAKCDANSVKEALRRAIEDKDHRHALATAAWHRFRDNYAPAVVARKYADLFRAVVNR
jgi:glycosyltransferase involved in cell wall biosynthesis